MAGSSSALSFLEDHDRWRRIHDDVWTFHLDLNLLGVVPMGRRMAAVRRPGAGWALLSPVLLDDASRKQLTDAGPVEALIVPTAIHNTWVPESCVVFAAATAYLARGARRRDLPPERCRKLPQELPHEWTTTIEPLPLDGMPRINEVVFLHRPSRTLIVADLCFNFDRRYPASTRALYWLFGASSGLRFSRLFRSMIRDRPAFLRSLDRILGLDFDRLVVCHGSVVETGAREALGELRRTLG